MNTAKILPRLWTVLSLPKFWCCRACGLTVVVVCGLFSNLAESRQFYEQKVPTRICLVYHGMQMTERQSGWLVGYPLCFFCDYLFPLPCSVREPLDKFPRAVDHAIPVIVHCHDMSRSLENNHLLVCGGGMLHDKWGTLVGDDMIVR